MEVVDTRIEIDLLIPHPYCHVAPMSTFNLRFPLQKIEYWASQYVAEVDAVLEKEIGPAIQPKRFLTKPQFLALSHWKSPRTQPRCATNSEEYIQAVTTTALTTSNEQLRIEVLCLLKGVNWPTASVILHFGSHEPYPILDVRALWSVGYETPPAYHFDFWWEYVKFTRGIAAHQRISMRTIDRALWQFSKVNQK